MSEPSAAWISMLSSGVSSIGVPSRWFWKRTPSSVILRSLASDQTWKPPESVRIGWFQPVNRCRPPRSRDQVVARAQPQVVGVAEDDLGAELLELLRVQRLDRSLGADRHEHRGFHRAVGQGEPAAAGLAGRVGGEEVEHPGAGG